jgi:hypothetical protein
MIDRKNPAVRAHLAANVWDTIAAEHPIPAMQELARIYGQREREKREKAMADEEKKAAMARLLWDARQ